jgi:hypothetical protein
VTSKERLVRRWILTAASAAALAAAMAVGPFGAAAAAPYVYGCTPATMRGPMVNYDLSLTIYNGSATTANLTHKILAGNGAILNAGSGLNVLPTTSTLPATHTAAFEWSTPQGEPSATGGTLAGSVRIVSNVPVAATLNHDPTETEDWKPIPCMPMQP